MQRLIGQRLLKDLTPQEKPFEIRDARQKGFLLRVQPSGSMSYICEYARGKRITIAKVGAIKPEQARDRAGEIMAQAKSGKDPISEKKKANTTTLGGFVENRYRPWVEAHRKDGEATVRRINSRFEAFLKKKLSDLTPWQFDKWRSERLKSGVKPNTVNRDIAALKAALSKAVEWGVVEVHPLTKLKPSKIDQSKKVRFLSPEEEASLRGALRTRDSRLKQQRESGNRWRAERGYALMQDLSSVPFADYLEPMVLLCLNTGMRRGEVFNLRWSDVHFQTSTLTVEGATAKSGKTRHIPLNREAMDTLKRWHEQTGGEGLVFPGKDGLPLDNIKRAWSSLLKEAGIVNFRFHDLRHHFASRLVMAGVALNTVRELLGHSDIKMTLRYAHLAPGHKAEAVESLLATNGFILPNSFGRAK